MISEDDVQRNVRDRLAYRRAEAAGLVDQLRRARTAGAESLPGLEAVLPRAVGGVERHEGHYLTWIVDEPGDEHVPGRGSRDMVSADDGEVHVQPWPTWAIDDIRRLMATTDARFPAVVRAYLLDAGWRPGRRLPGLEVEQWFADRPGVPGVELLSVATIAMAEFGGLRLRAHGYCDVEFFPHPVEDRRWRSAAAATPGTTALCPVAEDHLEGEHGLISVVEMPDGRSSVRIDGEIDQYEAGSGIDEMIISYVTGRPLAIVD